MFVGLEKGQDILFVTLQAGNGELQFFNIPKDLVLYVLHCHPKEAKKIFLMFTLQSFLTFEVNQKRWETMQSLISSNFT